MSEILSFPDRHAEQLAAVKNVADLLIACLAENMATNLSRDVSREEIAALIAGKELSRAYQVDTLQGGSDYYSFFVQRRDAVRRAQKNSQNITTFLNNLAEQDSSLLVAEIAALRRLATHNPTLDGVTIETIQDKIHAMAEEIRHH